MRLLFCRCWEQMCLMSSVKWRGFAEGTSLISSSIRSCRVHHLRELQRAVEKKPQVIDSFYFFFGKKNNWIAVLAASWVVPFFSFAKTCPKFNKTRPPGGMVQWRGRFFFNFGLGLGGGWGTNKWAERKREEVSVCSRCRVTAWKWGWMCCRGMKGAGRLPDLLSDPAEWRLKTLKPAGCWTGRVTAAQILQSKFFFNFFFTRRKEKNLFLIDLHCLANLKLPIG